MNKHNAEAVATQIEEQWGNVFVASAVRSIGEENAKLRDETDRLRDCLCHERTRGTELLGRAEAAEAKLKAASEQEPVVEVTCVSGSSETESVISRTTRFKDGRVVCGTKLYAAPVPPVDVQELQKQHHEALVAKELQMAELSGRQLKRIAELERKLAEAQTSIEWWMKAAECTKDKLAQAREEGRKEAVPEGWLARFDEAVDCAKLVGAVDAKRGFGCFTQQDSRTLQATYEAIYRHRNAMLAAAPTPGESLKPSFSVEWTIDHLAHPQIESGEKE